MRDVYYQSAGNPLQKDRLPLTRPATEFVPNTEGFDAILSIVEIVAVTVIIGAVILLLYRAPGFSWFDPYDLLMTVPVVVVSLLRAGMARDLRHIHHPITLAAAGILCLNHRMPWSLQILIFAALNTLLIYQFGQHAIALMTGQPVRRALAIRLRESASRQLRILAVMTGILVAAVLWFGLKILIFAACTMPISFLCAPTQVGLLTNRPRMWLSCLKSWYAYAPQNLPGLMQSPAGPRWYRIGILFLAAQLTAMMLVSWENSPLPHMFSIGAYRQVHVTDSMNAAGAGPIERVKHGAVTWITTFSAMVAIPVVVPLALAVAIGTPVLCEVAAAANRSNSNNVTQSVIADIPSSPDPVERNSIYMGRVVSDGSPVLIPRQIFSEHAHGLGDSGSGKTSLFLCPLIEQLAMSGDCSIIVIDLKADSLELLATQMAAAERLRSERGINIPVKCFSNQTNRSTFAFNPMTQPFWESFDLQTRTDILCGANGLTYGTDYGAGYFSSANSAVLYHTLKAFPDVRTFEELAECLGTVITTAKKRDLHPEIRKAGVHVQEVIKRLAACAPLNVTDRTGHEATAVEQAIDLTQPFLSPQMLYFHLSATLSPSGAPEIGRLVNYILLAASTQTHRKHQVYLVIDEFQRMVASNLEYMLQLARSMGVGVILANQSMDDLRRSSVNLVTPIEANCRVRQWFSVSSSADQDRIIHSSGETVNMTYGRSHKGITRNPGRYRSYSEGEFTGPRISRNDVLLTSDHPFRSILRIGRGQGYAQFGGMPVIIESNFHISEAEYRRRRAMPWPSLPGMFLPGSARAITEKSVGTTPQFTREVIGGEVDKPSPFTPDAMDSFLKDLQQSFNPVDHSPKRRRTP